MRQEMQTRRTAEEIARTVAEDSGAPFDSLWHRLAGPSRPSEPFTTPRQLAKHKIVKVTEGEIRRKVHSGALNEGVIRFGPRRTIYLTPYAVERLIELDTE